MHIRAACKAFIDHCERRQLSPHTLRAYDLDLQRFTTFAGATTLVGSCDRCMIQAYVDALFRTFRLHPASVKRHLATLQSFFRWLEAEECVSEDPVRRASVRIKVPKRLPRLLSRPEVRAMLATSSNGELTGQVAVELLFGTGMRVSELARLRDTDVDLDAATITIIGKGDRQRRVYIPDQAIASLIAEYRLVRDHHEYFLVNPRGKGFSPDAIRRLVHRVAQRAQLTRRITPHMFRHSFATYLLEEGVDIRYVQRLLGHRSITTTEIYTHVSDEALKARVSAHHPRQAIVKGTSWK